MSDIKKSDKNIDEETFNKLNVFLIGMKKLLNIYSHTSFDGVMFLLQKDFNHLNLASLISFLFYL